jgi:hypothetical protein
MSLIDKEYKKVKDVYKLNKKTFKERKENIKNLSFDKVNWSSSYLDFFQYEYEFNQLKPPQVSSKIDTLTIQNNFIDNNLIYSFNKQNENWGFIFVDYNDDFHGWFLFVENDDDKMVLQQLKLKYFENNRISNVLMYNVDEDLEEESLFVDSYVYHNDLVSKIYRNGFYEEKKRILPQREFSFIYEDDKVKIISRQEVLNGEIRELKIFEGRK